MPSILFRPKPNVEKTPAAPKASPLCCGSQNQLTKSTNMSTALNNNSTRSTVPGTVAISDDEMRRFAPSVFASQPIEGVSERYSFLPTSSILNGMRENGWVPVRAQEQSIRTEARRGFQKHVVRFARLQHLQTWERNQVRPEVISAHTVEAEVASGRLVILHMGGLPIMREWYAVHRSDRVLQPAGRAVWEFMVTMGHDFLPKAEIGLNV